MIHPSRLTFHFVKHHLGLIGVTITKQPHYNQYTVTLKGKPQTAYYTEDLDDAFATGQRMAEQNSEKSN